MQIRLCIIYENLKIKIINTVKMVNGICYSNKNGKNIVVIVYEIYSCSIFFTIRIGDYCNSVLKRCDIRVII